LRVVGDALDNTVVVSRDPGGTILVNDGAVAIQGGQPTVANTRLIMITGAGGNDNLALDETDGALPAAAIFGGDGDDVLVGGSGDDFFDGGAGNDTISMGAGDDTFRWNPGNGSDVVEGGAGRDTLMFNGSDLPEIFGISANGDRVRLSRDLGNVTMDVKDVETIDVNALGGADKVVVNDLSGTDVEEIDLSLAAISGGNAGDGQLDSVIVNGGAAGERIPVQGTAGGILVNGGFAQGGSLQYFMIIRAVEPADSLQINGNGGDDTIDASTLQTPVTFRAEGRAGNDILLGSPGDDVLVGGDGNDAIDGNGGSDFAFLGAGDDSFIWDPGDGNDTVEGMDGADTLIFRGSNGGEGIDLSASGDRLRLVRNVGTVTMDVDDVELVDVITLGGQDTVTVNDLAATDVSVVDVNLGAGGTTSGDLLADNVVVNGSVADDRITVSEIAGVPVVIRPTTIVRVTAPDPTLDTLTVNGLAGNDTIDASELPSGRILFVADGGAGNDTITGGPGNDTITGGPGNDLAFLGAGDDTFAWNPGDGSDTVEGGDGNDKLNFNGSDLAENVVISSNGGRVRLSRDVGTVTLDVNTFEGIELNALGGADTITVDNLSGTGLVKVQLNLKGSAGIGDGQPDNIIVNGTDADDGIRLAAAGNTILVDGLFPVVRITGSDGVNDHLTVNALGGHDTVDATNLPANLIGLTVDLGGGQAAAATTTMLSTSTATAVFGQAEVLTATVSSPAGTPTGTVTFLEGNSALGTVPVDAEGQAILPVSLGVGNHALTASFAGSGGFTGSGSAAATVTINRAATRVALASSVNPAVAGRAATFTATVAAVAPGAGAPTGTVTFFVGHNVLARLTLDANGQARITRSFSRTGLFTIRAVYIGDAHLAASSQALTEQVNRHPRRRPLHLR
jgi:Ca2+-binding RTX toxin-like protein